MYILIFYITAVSVEKVKAKLLEALVNSLNAQIISHSSGASAPASTHFNFTEKSIFSYIAVRFPFTYSNFLLSFENDSLFSVIGTLCGSDSVWYVAES